MCSDIDKLRALSVATVAEALAVTDVLASLVRAQA